MGMQSDVLSVHTNITCLLTSGRARVKGLVVTGSGSAGYFYLWDSTVGPTSATYARSSGGLITVTQTAHGLVTGDQVGLVFGAGTGGQATTGNYAITKLTADTYTVQDINAGAITAGASALQNTRWLTSIDMGANESVAFPLPAEGILARNGMYVTVSNLSGLTIFYG